MANEKHIWVWRSLVACLNGVQEAGSSNLLTQTEEVIAKSLLFLCFGAQFDYFGFVICHIINPSVGCIVRSSGTLYPAASVLNLFSHNYTYKNGSKTVQVLPENGSKTVQAVLLICAVFSRLSGCCTFIVPVM